MGVFLLDEKKYRVFSGVLYPDSTSYDCSLVLSEIASRFKEWAYILHNDDYNDDGSKKKDHYHWIGKGDPRSLGAVSRFLGIPEHDIEIGKSFTLLIQYLIHQNDQSKTQYEPFEVSSNIADINKFFRRIPEGQIVADLCVVKRERSWLGLVQYAVSSNCYDVLRRNLGIIKLVFDEEHPHNMSG